MSDFLSCPYIGLHVRTVYRKVQDRKTKALLTRNCIYVLKHNRSNWRGDSSAGDSVKKVKRKNL